MPMNDGGDDADAASATAAPQLGSAKHAAALTHLTSRITSLPR